jgi:tetratricopeptide (TPR) repeat protein
LVSIEVKQVLPGHLIELLMDIYVTADAGVSMDISGLSDDVLASLLRRSLAAGFGDILDEDGLSALATMLDRYDMQGQPAGTLEKASLCRTIFNMFRGQSPGSVITYKVFDRHFKRFTSALNTALEQAAEPQLMDTPCREFGELDLDELSRMQVPEELSGYMTGLVQHFQVRGAITASDADHVAELIEKMASAPGYLRFLSKEKRYQEIVWLFGVVRDLQSSGFPPDTAMDDMKASLGLLLFNIRPSEKVASYLASVRPSGTSRALQYHYNVILALNHMITGRFHLASVHSSRALQMTSDKNMMAYVAILQGCIAIRQGDYDRAIALLNDASSRIPAGRTRLRALIAFYCGVIFFEKREYANAIMCFESAGAAVTDPLDMVAVHNNIGSCAMYLGDVCRAEEEFLQMEKHACGLNSQLARKCQLSAHSYIGAISRALGDHITAIERYENALKLAIGSKDGKAVANQMGNLGTAYAKAGDHAKALHFLNSCLTYSERMGYWAGIRFAYWHICRTLMENGHRSEARKFSDTYASRYPELNNLRPNS